MYAFYLIIHSKFNFACKLQSIFESITHDTARRGVMQKESFTQSQGSVLFDHFHYTSLRNMRKLVCVCECKKRISGAILIIFFAHSFRFGFFFVDFIKKNIIFAYFHCNKTADSRGSDKAQKPHKKFQDQNKKIFSAQKCSSLHACKILFELINIQYAF